MVDVRAAAGRWVLSLTPTWPPAATTSESFTRVLTGASVSFGRFAGRGSPPVDAFRLLPP